jgi:hypothetical protein
MAFRPDGAVKIPRKRHKAEEIVTKALPVGVLTLPIWPASAVA